MTNCLSMANKLYKVGIRLIFIYYDKYQDIYIFTVIRDRSFALNDQLDVATHKIMTDNQTFCQNARKIKK